MDQSPIALFVYNRLWHTQQTIEALQQNELAGASELFIFSDGPKSDDDSENVQLVREYLKTVTGFERVTVTERDSNLGLAQSIIAGVTEIVNKYGKVIVLEDDLVTSPYFLRYMNEALAFYQDEDRVISIHGYIYPVRKKLPETFFLKGADCWGWATWEKGWNLFEPDGRKLLDELRARNLTRRFDFDGAYAYTQMLENQVEGINNSWAIRWYAAAFLKDKLTLYPGRSLVRNIGTDASGTNCGESVVFNTELSLEPVRIGGIPVEENLKARAKIRKYFFRSFRPSIAKMVTNRINLLLGRDI